MEVVAATCVLIEEQIGTRLSGELDQTVRWSARRSGRHSRTTRLSGRGCGSGGGKVLLLCLLLLRAAAVLLLLLLIGERGGDHGG